MTTIALAPVYDFLTTDNTTRVAPSALNVIQGGTATYIINTSGTTRQYVYLQIAAVINGVAVTSVTNVTCCNQTSPATLYPRVSTSVFPAKAMINGIEYYQFAWDTSTYATKYPQFVFTMAH